MTTTKNCYVCAMTYKWNDSTKACELCTATSACPTSGCGSLTYPGKPSSSSSSDADNSTILVFMISTLLALITLLI